MDKMKKMYGLLLGVFVGMTLLTGCGDDRLIMTTTENTRTTTEKQTNSENTTEEQVTEEASGEDKALTLSVLHEANKGDVLLKDSAGVKLQFDFYDNGNRVLQENYFIGFDSDGNYVQSYENSEGVANVLDHRHGCWYISDADGIYTKIYPENGISERLVDYYHNDTVYPVPKEGDSEEIKDIYRQSGNLILETHVTRDSEEYEYTYILDDEYKILSYECRIGDTVVMTETTSLNVTYAPPSVLEELSDRTNERIITVKNVDYGIEYNYSVSSLFPVDFETYGANIYIDEACNVIYDNISQDSEFRDENGSYQNLTLYLKEE